jgi:putative transposase
LDTCKWVYNKTLELRKDAWEKDQENISLYNSSFRLKLWKEKNDFLYQVHSQVLQQVQQRVDLAFKAFFRRCKAGEDPGYPRFKGKNRYDSFTFPQSGFKLIDSKLKLSLIGDVPIVLHRQLQGTVKTLNIKKTPTGKWFATFSCELSDINIVQPIESSVGIDLGLTTFATLSNGDIIPRQRFFKQYEKRLTHASRKRELLEKGSKQRNKARLIESKIHEKLTNIRKDFAHKAALNLVNKYDLIVFEDLSIDKMQDTNMKAVKKGIADVAWNQFVQFTQYKAENAGKRVILIDPKNTSKICSRCGSLIPKELSERTHSCSCGLVLDRDLNASINILRRGIASLDLK